MSAFGGGFNRSTQHLLSCQMRRFAYGGEVAAEVRRALLHDARHEARRRHRVVPIDFLRLPLIAVVGALVYGEPFEPAVLLGALVIFAGSYYSLSREGRQLAR